MEINNQLYYNTAESMGFDCRLEEYIASFVIFFGGKRYYVRPGCLPFNYDSSVNVARNKYCVNKLLMQSGIPVPKATAFVKHVFEKSGLDLQDLKFPVVAKPTVDTALGSGVFCNIKDEETLKKYLKKKFKEHYIMSIEEFQAGLRSYRVLVFYGKVIGVIERIPAHVFGDGIHTLQEIITSENEKRAAMKQENNVTLGPIELAEEQLAKLAEMGISLSDIPKKDERIDIAFKCNSSVGGIMRTANHEICKENKRLAKRAAEVLNLALVGFDVLCEDIGKPIGPTRGFFIEANYNPDVSIHENPVLGKSTPVTKYVLRRFFRNHPFHFLLLKIKKHKTQISFYLKILLFIVAIIFIHKIT